ncbi:MAG: alpha-1,2-fucosyltransferase [Pirellulaceae bacterium]|nr:alpha-1,2-fucosyltransferase [Pirellulaceae bacterium]
MIVSRIDGGLGNQMFQVAFGLQLAQQHSTQLVLDLSAYGDGPAHGYMLDRFCVSAKFLSFEDQQRLPRRYRPRSARLGWSDWLAGNQLRRVKEKPYGYADRYLRAGDDSYLVGYWQSDQYFPDVQDQVRQQFRLAEPLSATSQRLWDHMIAKPSLAIHVRRGDYLSKPQAASIYRHLSLDYYRRAVLARLTERTGVHVVVFSNDIDWCRQHLALPCPVQFVTSSAGAHEELWLMTAAECVVMANSTFSWWGAWLSQREEPRVFAPRRWFHPGTLNDHYLACPGWTLMDDMSSQAAAA